MSDRIRGDWQPISTLPQGVIVYLGDCNTGHVTLGSVMSYAEFVDALDRFSHWAPFPTPEAPSKDDS